MGSTQNNKKMNMRPRAAISFILEWTLTYKYDRSVSLEPVPFTLNISFLKLFGHVLGI